MSEPLTLPSINIFSDPNVLQTLWNYTGSTFTLGMPILLITVALLLIPSVWDLIIDSLSHAAGKKDRERSRDDWEEDDDW